MSDKSEILTDEQKAALKDAYTTLRAIQGNNDNSAMGMMCQISGRMLMEAFPLIERLELDIQAHYIWQQENKTL